MTECLIDDEQGSLNSIRGCIDEIFTLKQIVEKICRVYMGLMDLKKAYNRVNREVLWQGLRMYDVARKLLEGIKSM